MNESQFQKIAKLACEASVSKGYNVEIILSSGLRAFDTYTTASFSVTALGNDSSGWSEATHRNVNAINPTALAQLAIEKAKKGANPKEVPSGRYTVVLEPSAVAELLLFMAFDGLGAHAYQEGSSFLSNRIGSKVMDERITLMDNVYDPQAIGLPFDYEGMPRKPVTLIENGIARGVVHDLQSARQGKSVSTGHALPKPNTEGPLPLHLVLKPGESTMADMIASVDRGILVTRFHYTNLIDPTPLTITGMTRDGTFWIENGKIRHPIKNMRFTEGVVAAFNQIEQVGRDSVYTSSFWGGEIVAPALKINNFNFSSGTLF